MVRRLRYARSGRLLLAFPLNDDEITFWAFHEENPHVYKWIEIFADEAIARGEKKIGIDMLLGGVRWHVHIRTTDPHYKISNNHKPYYARLWRREHPANASFIETHVLFSAAVKRARAAFAAGGDPYSPPVRPSRRPPSSLQH
jgi:hypothetical protein